MMEQRKTIELFDELIEAKKAVESMQYLTMLLIDAYTANADENSVRVMYLYYTYSKMLLTILGDSVDIVDEYLGEVKIR